LFVCSQFSFSLSGKTLLEAVKLIKPTALVGVSAQRKAFSREVCEEMTKNDKNPLIYALSNPTSKAECTAEEAYTWTDGECVDDLFHTV
jgi:malate dehydrogenase (oxaloacetate-decarboxylating)(NADP+)